jgi:hypothetical protein
LLLSSRLHKKYYSGIITSINNNIFNVIYDIEPNHEYKIPIYRISTDEIDKNISIIWNKYMKLQLNILKKSNSVSTIYIRLFDVEKTKIFIEECLDNNILLSSD